MGHINSWSGFKHQIISAVRLAIKTYVEYNLLDKRKEDNKKKRKRNQQQSKRTVKRKLKTVTQFPNFHYKITKCFLFY